MRIKAGTILMITHGCYSDYSFDGPFIVLKDFDQAAVAEEFLRAWRAEPREEWDRPYSSDFIGWLARQDYVEDAKNEVTWHVGDYGFEPEVSPDAH